MNILAIIDDKRRQWYFKIKTFYDAFSLINVNRYRHLQLKVKEPSSPSLSMALQLCFHFSRFYHFMSFQESKSIHLLAFLIMPMLSILIMYYHNLDAPLV